MKINNVMHLLNSILKLLGYFNPIERNGDICKRGVENLDTGAGVNFAGFDRMLGLIHSIIVSRGVF